MIEDKATEISFFRIDEGEAIIYARTDVSPDGRFSFMIEIPAEGFYAVGLPGSYGLLIPVYLKPGDNAEMEIYYDENYFRNRFTRNNTPENVMLGLWAAMSETVREKAIYPHTGPGRRSTYEDFYPDLEALISEAQNFKKDIHTRNSKFNASMEQLVDFNIEYYALRYMRTERSKQSEARYVKPDIYTSMIRPNRFSDNAVLATLHGAAYISDYMDHAAANMSVEEKNVYMATDAVRGVYYLPEILKASDYSAYLVQMEHYGKYLGTEKQRKIAEEFGSNLYDPYANSIAVDFTYPDIDGKDVSLSDFVGKVVVVDVWATWCAPCKAEIPHLKKLEEEFADNDGVVFIGVSVDERKNYEKWRNMVRDEKLPGTHLFADGGRKIRNDYKIKGIPRFLVFAKDGSIVSAQAPRPSSPDLKTIIEKELAE